MNLMIGLTCSVSTTLATLLWTTNAGGEQAFSPRGYCHGTGGAVLETGDRGVYLCCYAAKQHCLAVNTRSRKSVQVTFPDDISDSTVAEMDEVTKSGANSIRSGLSLPKRAE